MNCKPFLLCCLFLPAWNAQAESLSDDVILYRSPEERREAGLGRSLADGLLFSGLIELETVRTKDWYSDGIIDSDEEPPMTTLQLGFALEAFEWLEAELILEAEWHRQAHGKVDEAFVGANFDQAGIKIGQQELPFGEFFSHFVTGPMLEFGEVQRMSVIVDGSLHPNLELTVFVMAGKVDETGSANQQDWGAALQWWSDNEAIRLGLGYLNDLAETEEPILEGSDTTRYKTVAGWNAYCLWGVSKSLELTAELVRTIGRFRELEPDLDQPEAENLELAWALHDQWQWALRIEHSQELADAPQWKYGTSVAWRPLPRLGIAMDYLYSDYRNPHEQEDDSERGIKRGHELAALVSLEF